MPAPSADPGAAASPRGGDRPGPVFHDIRSADGTRLRAWDNGVEGPTVLLCNGLGTNPYAWPSLLDPGCGVHVVSWMHRGTGGSERPRRRDATGITEFVQDAVAVMDDQGVATAPVIGWSMGVNTAFELALRHPERVSGILAVAGVPGATFDTMLGPLLVPPPVARAFATSTARAGALMGPALSALAGTVPVGAAGVRALRWTGFMGRIPDPEGAATAIREFLTTPMDWYFHMVLATGRHERVSLSRVPVPATFLAGRHDILAGTAAMRTAAQRMPRGRYVELAGTHFLPLERPDAVLAELHALLATVDPAAVGPATVD